MIQLVLRALTLSIQLALRVLTQPRGAMQEHPQQQEMNEDSPTKPDRGRPVIEFITLVVSPVTGEAPLSQSIEPTNFLSINYVYSSAIG